MARVFSKPYSPEQLFTCTHIRVAERQRMIKERKEVALQNARTVITATRGLLAADPKGREKAVALALLVARRTMSTIHRPPRTAMGDSKSVKKSAKPLGNENVLH